MEDADRWLKHKYRVYCLSRSPVEGVRRRELEPIAIHRLGLDIGD
jgi:hypothetical protein